MISLVDIRKAADILQGKVIRTPLIYSPTFSSMSGAEVYLKLENLQGTGSFKLRGATFKIQSHLKCIGPEGVVAASAGNHAQGVAMAAKRAGLPATIVMPEWASITKQEATKSYGGHVLLEGQSIGDAINKACELAEAGKTFIHPFDDPDIITGQGTIGLEIFEDLPDADVIFVPVGGGGLASGIAIAAKAIRPWVHIVGVQTEACPGAYRAREHGAPTRVEAEKSIADGIAVKQIGNITFPIIQEKLDDIVLVKEEEIAEAILMLLERKRILAEGAGAVPLAALLGGYIRFKKGMKTVLVISGGNLDSHLLDRVIRKGLFCHGRIMRISVCLEDVPGSLARLLSVVARSKANVLNIFHARSERDLAIHLSRVELELETRGPAHIREILDELENAGYQINIQGTDV
ncbi:MAG TPA: threonine ammonia-lyase [Syntrophales bacterium]|nr:threonine ammonia-lyase [Syntrophales bacterium]